MFILAGTACLIFGSRRFLHDWLHVWFALPRITRWGLAALLLLGILSSLNALAVRYALLEMSVFVMLFVWAIAVAGCYRKFPQLATILILGTVLLCTFFYSIKFFTSYLIYLFVEGALLWPAGDMVLGFSHVRFFNQIQTWTIPLLILAIWLLPPKYIVLKWCLSGLASIWWMLVFAADARGTIIASSFAIFSIAVLYRKQAFSWVYLQIVTSVSGFFLYLLLFRIPSGEAGSGLIRYGGTGRLNMWSNAESLIRQDPVLGVGPMHYGYFENQFAFAHPHNAYLQFAAEWGMFSFLILFMIILYGYYALFRQNHDVCKKEQGGVAMVVRTGITASLLAAAVHASVSGIIVMPMSQMYMALIPGWALGIYFLDKKNTSMVLPKYSEWLLRLLLLCAIIFMVWGTSKDVLTLNKDQETYREEHNPQRFAPRFWHQGLIEWNEEKSVKQ
ncbi:MAG: O-antigen ligase family protein [Balneolales bacterium]